MAMCKNHLNAVDPEIQPGRESLTGEKIAVTGYTVDRCHLFQFMNHLHPGNITSVKENIHFFSNQRLQQTWVQLSDPVGDIGVRNNAYANSSLLLKDNQLDEPIRERTS